MFVLDTNVVSEMRKIPSGTANAQVARWAGGIPASDMYISAITVEELERGVLRISRKDAAQGAILRTWLDRYVLPTFNDRILPVDVPVARRCAELQVPDPRPFRDSYIAATALVHGMTVVTRDAADFAPMGVRVLDPWAA